MTGIGFPALWQTVLDRILPLLVASATIKDNRVCESLCRWSSNGDASVESRPANARLTDRLCITKALSNFFSTQNRIGCEATCLNMQGSVLVVRVRVGGPKGRGRWIDGFDGWRGETRTSRVLEFRMRMCSLRSWR